MGTTNQGRPIPLHGSLEEDAIDYRLCRDRVLADGRITEREARAVIAIADRLEARARQVAARDAATVALLAGRDGLTSKRFLERVRHANGGTLIYLPSARPEDPEPEPHDARAA